MRGDIETAAWIIFLGLILNGCMTGGTSTVILEAMK
jgi:hypothetical protein